MILRIPITNTWKAILDFLSVNFDYQICFVKCNFFYFYIYREPNSEKLPIWESYKLNQTFIKFGIGRSPITSMQNDFLNDRMQFWEKLMNKVSSPIIEVTVTDDEVIPDIEYASTGILITNNIQCIIIILLTTTFFI